MSELIKFGYKSIGGFFAVLFMFVFGVTAFALILSGALIVTMAIYGTLNPSFFELIPVQVFSSQISDPGVTAFLLLIAAIILIAVGSLFLGLTFLIARSAKIIDQELEKIIDRNIAPLSGSSPPDKISQLERLGNLRDRNVISEAEFQKEKAKILQQDY